MQKHTTTYRAVKTNTASLQMHSKLLQNSFPSPSHCTSKDNCANSHTYVHHGAVYLTLIRLFPVAIATASFWYSCFSLQHTQYGVHYHGHRHMQHGKPQGTSEGNGDDNVTICIGIHTGAMGLNHTLQNLW